MATVATVDVFHGFHSTNLLEIFTAERDERRRSQKEAWRRRNGIQPKKARQPGAGTANWAQLYFHIWGKPPGAPLTPAEFAARDPLWNAWVAGREQDG